MGLYRAKNGDEKKGKNNIDIDELATLDDVAAIESRLSGKENRALDNLKKFEKELGQEGYDGAIMRALLVSGLKLFSPQARIGEFYINKDDYWDNVRKQLHSSMYHEAEQTLHFLMMERVITTKKREAVYRLNTHWDTI